MKLKIILIGIAIVFAVGGSLVTRAGSSMEDFCEGYVQYRKVGTSYVPAGSFGYNYYCWGEAGVCTYYKPMPGVEVYYPCRTGVYEQIIP